MQKSENINELAAALSQFQGDVPLIPKDKEVSFVHGGQATRYKYADLATINDKIKAPLKATGLSVSQIVTDTHLYTLLMHSSGQYLQSQIALKTAYEAKLKDFGTQLTYLRRYALCAILGLAADEDDDAQQTKDEPSIVKERPLARISGDLLKSIVNQLGVIGDPNLERNIIEGYAKKHPALNIKVIADIPEAHGVQIRDTLKARIEELQA
jgi:hypothetical protein